MQPKNRLIPGCPLVIDLSFEPASVIRNRGNEDLGRRASCTSRPPARYLPHFEGHIARFIHPDATGVMLTFNLLRGLGRSKPNHCTITDELQSIFSIVRAVRFVDVV